MVSFFLTSGSRIWYVVGAYMTPNDALAIHYIEPAFEVASKGMEVILLGGLNVMLRKPRDAREDELVTALSDSGLVDVTDHFMTRRRYIGAGSWT